MSHNAPQDIDLVSAGGSKAETRLFFDDQVFEVFSGAFQENLFFGGGKHANTPSHISLQMGTFFWNLIDHPLLSLTGKRLRQTRIYGKVEVVILQKRQRL